MKHTLYLLFILFTIYNGFTQQSPFLYYKDNVESEAKSCIETHDGRLVLAGWEKTIGGDRQAMVILLPNSPNDTNGTSNTFGNDFDDVAHAVIETPEGNLLLAGFTGHNNGQTAWLLMINREGQPLWEWQDPEPEKKSALYDVIWYGDNEVMAAGEKDGKIYMMAIQPMSNTASRTLMANPTPFGCIRAITAGPAGMIAVTGYQFNGKREQEVFVNQVGGNLQWSTSKDLFKKPIEGATGSDILFDGEKQLYLVSIADESNAEISQTTLYKIPLKGRGTIAPLYPLKSLEDNSKNTAQGILRLPTGEYILAGFTNRIGRLFGEFRPLAVKGETSSDKENSKEVVISSPSKGLLYGAVLRHDGSVWMTGTANNYRKSQACAIQIDGIKGLPASNQEPLGITNIRFEDSGNNDTLNANEQASIRFQFKKTGYKPIWGLRAVVSLTGNKWGVRYSGVVHLGHLLGDSTSTGSLSIPLAGASYLADGKTSASIRLYDAQMNLLDELPEVSFPTKADPEAHLSVRFDLKDSTLVPREEDIPVTICIRNDGPGIATKVELEVNPPYLVELRQLSKPQTSDTLLPGDSVCYQARLKVSYLYQDEYFIVNATAFESRNYYASVHYKSLALRVPPFYQIILPRQAQPIHLKNIERKMQKGGPHAPIPPYIKKDEEYIIEFQYLSFSKQNQHIRDSLNKLTTKKVYEGIEFREPEFPLKVLIYRKDGGQVDSAYIQENLILYRRDNKGKESPLGKVKDLRMVEDTMLDDRRYFFGAVHVDLVEGKNILQLKLEGNNGKTLAESTTQYVIYIPPTIHCLFIGVPYPPTDPLKFPPKNAAIMKSTFDAAITEGRMMYLKKGSSIIETSVAGTSRDSLYNFITKNWRQKSGIKLQPADYYLLFVSGHGEINAYGEFDLICSDDDPKDTTRAYSLQTNFFGEIVKPQFRKTFLFLDLCQSGAVEELPIKPFPSSLDTSPQLITDPKRYYIFPSTGDDTAYELDSLSLFTRAIVEAITNQKVQENNQHYFPDMYPEDGVLTIGELYTFWNRRRKHLYEVEVQQKGKSKNGREQTNGFKEEYRDSTTPLLRFSKQ